MCRLLTFDAFTSELRLIFVRRLSLQLHSLSQNKIGDAGAAAIGEALKRNKTLTALECVTVIQYSLLRRFVNVLTLRLA